MMISRCKGFSMLFCYSSDQPGKSVNGGINGHVKTSFGFEEGLLFLSAWGPSIMLSYTAGGCLELDRIARVLISNLCLKYALKI